MEYKIEGIWENMEHTIGFTQIKKFEGVKTEIAIEYLIEVINMLKSLKKMGFETVVLGIEDRKPLLIFLDDKDQTALAIAPRFERMRDPRYD